MDYQPTPQDLDEMQATQLKMDKDECFRREFLSWAARDESRKNGVEPWTLGSSAPSEMSSAGYRL